MSETNRRRTVVTRLEEIKGTQEWLDKYFPIVRASTLSLEDEFLKHNPTSERQKETKKEIISAIESGLCDFRAQRMDPTLDENGNICYKAGKRPAVEKITKWWYENAKKFLPEKKSRVGINKERYAFLALLIKYLIEKENYTISGAWKAVCDQSKNLGHFKDSKNAKGNLEPTGSRKVGEWYDLGNTCKVIVNEKGTSFSFFGGDANFNGDYYTLSYVSTTDYLYFFCILGVGWLVLDV